MRNKNKYLISFDRDTGIYYISDEQNGEEERARIIDFHSKSIIQRTANKVLVKIPKISIYKGYAVWCPRNFIVSEDDSYRHFGIFPESLNLPLEKWKDKTKISAVEISAAELEKEFISDPDRWHQTYKRLLKPR